MTDELFSLRVIVASGSRVDRELFRRAASESRVPIEIIEADNAAVVSRSIAAGAEFAFLDMALGGDAVAQITAAARTAAKPPFTVLLCAAGAAAPFLTDALATKPSQLQEAKRLLDGSTRVRLPSRALIVDDSATTRSIVRKILAATRFPLDVTEAEQGGKAIELVRQEEFDIAFIDYYLPDLSGLETIAEFRRAQWHPACVLMTSAQDEAVAARAQAQGVAYLKKPFFPADMQTVLCGFYGLRALNPKRA